MLNDAIADVAAEVRKGVALETTVAEVAADYGLRPELLGRKVSEAYPNGIAPLADSAWLANAARQLAAFEAEDRAFDAALARQVANYKTAMRRATQSEADVLLRKLLRALVG